MSEESQIQRILNDPDIRKVIGGGLVLVGLVVIYSFSSEVPGDKFVEVEREVIVHVQPKEWWNPGAVPVLARPVDDSDFERKFFVKDELFQKYGMDSLLPNDDGYQCRIIHYHRAGLLEWILQPIGKKVDEYESESIGLWQPAGVYETVFLKEVPEEENPEEIQEESAAESAEENSEENTVENH